MAGIYSAGAGRLPGMPRILFICGLPPGADSAGVVRTPGLPSDQRPVWAVLRLREPGTPPPR